MRGVPCLILHVFWFDDFTRWFICYVSACNVAAAMLGWQVVNPLRRLFRFRSILHRSLDRWTCVHEHLQNSNYLHKQGVKSDMWVGAENHRRNKLVLAAVLFTCGSFVCYRDLRGWEFNLHMCAVHNENQNIWVHMVSAECWQHASASGVSQQSHRLLDMVYCSC